MYAIRSYYGTFEVKDGVTVQAKGKANRAVKAEYVPYVQKFVSAKGIEVNGDASFIGYVRQDGKSYSLYDLPQGFVIKSDLVFVITSYSIHYTKLYECGCKKCFSHLGS